MSIVQSSYSNTTNTRKNKLKNQIPSGHPPTCDSSAKRIFSFWSASRSILSASSALDLDFRMAVTWFCKSSWQIQNTAILEIWNVGLEWIGKHQEQKHITSHAMTKATLLYLVLLLLQHRSCPLRWTQLCKLPQSFLGLHVLTSQTVPLQLLFLLLKHGTLPSKWIGNSCKLFLQNNVGHLSNTTLSVYSTISWADPYGTAGLPSFPVKGWFQLPNLPGWTSNMPRLLPGGTQLKAIEDASNRTQRLNPVGRDRGRISRPHWGELFRKGLVYTIYILYSLGPAKTLQQ